MKCKILYIGFLSMMLGLGACIDDESTFETVVVPQLAVNGSGEETMPIYNFDLGTDCVITPEISYTGNADDLQYEWSIGTYTNGTKGVLEVVSKERTLNHRFTEGGSYYAHLVITDGQVGRTVDYQININRTFESGYFLVSNDENGKGNLVFVKTMTPEEMEAGTEQVYIEHSIEHMNEGTNVAKLLNTIYVTQTSENWQAGSFNRLVALAEDRAIFLDPNTLSILAELKYDEVYSGFKATNFIPDGYAPFLYDAKQEKYVHLNMEYMFPYENSEYVGYGFEDFISTTYYMWGGWYSTVMYANYSSDEICEYNAYYYYYGYDSPFVGVGDLLEGAKLQTAFFENSSAPLYILTRSKADEGIAYLHKLPGGISYMDSPYYDAPSKTELAIGADVAFPEEGTRLIYSSTYARHFYVYDDKIYVALVSNAATPFPKKSEYAISFSGEEITYMDINTTTEEVYVATYNESTKRGSFYIYDAKDIRTDNQGKITPKAVHKECADRIVSILNK